ISIPRVGQEVVVAFDEGDLDQPIILGGVYNHQQMPPSKLPEQRMFSGIKSNSVGGDPAKNFSGLAFNDTPGGERVALYAEKDMRVNAEHNNQHHVGNFEHVKIGKLHLSAVGGLPVGGGSGGGGGPSGLTDADATQIDPATGQPAPAHPTPPPRFMDWKTSNRQMAATPGLAGRA